MTGRQLFVAGVVLLWATVYLQGVSADTVIVEVDPTGQRTKVLEDWNDGTDNYASLHNVTSGGESDGVGNFSTAAGAFDPQFHYSETYDPVAFSWVRMRRQGSAGITELFPLSPASATTRIVFGTNPTELAEARKAFVNTDNITTPNGFRIDPTGANAGTFGYDYLMIDASETIGAGEWDENDGTDDFQGWSFSSAIDGESVANSLLSGTGSGDAYMWRNVIFDPD